MTANIKKKSCEATLKSDQNIRDKYKTSIIIESLQHTASVKRLCPLSGYYGEGLNAIIVFAACHLPDSSCEDYTYIMENLFL